MRFIYQAGCRIGYTLLLSSLLLLPAYAHAILLAATPAANQVVSGPDIPLSLKFNSRIDARRSRITLIGADGHETPVPIEDQTAADTLSAKARGLKGGPYILRWQVLAADGHITRGEVRFQVQ
jgi:copper resistance protein C